MNKLLMLSFFLFCFVATHPVGAMAGNRAVFLTPNEDDKLLPGVNFAIVANPSAYDIPLYALRVRYDDGFSDLAAVSYTPIHARESIAIPFNLEPGHGEPALIFVYQSRIFGDGVIAQAFGIVDWDENSQLFENTSNQFPVKTIISAIRPRKPIDTKGLRTPA